MNLANDLANAACYAAARTAITRNVSISEDDLDALACSAAIATMEEIASREHELCEASPPEENTSTQEECLSRIADYREAIAGLRAKARS